MGKCLAINCYSRTPTCMWILWADKYTIASKPLRSWGNGACTNWVYHTSFSSLKVFSYKLYCLKIICRVYLVCLLHLQVLFVESVYICEQIWGKGVTSRISRILVLKSLYLWNHSSYELQTWHEYSSIILLHSLQIASPAHFQCGRGKRARRSRSKNAVLWPSLAAHRSGQEACSSF